MSGVAPKFLELPAECASQEDYKEFAKQLDTWLETLRVRHDEQEHGIAELRQVAARIIELERLSKKVGKQVEQSAELLKASTQRVDRLDNQNTRFSTYLRDARSRASMTRDMNLDGTIRGPNFPPPPSQGEYRAIMLQLVQQSTEKELKRRRQKHGSSDNGKYDGGDERQRGFTTTPDAVAASCSPFPTTARTSSSPSDFSPSRPHRTRKRTWKSIEQDESPPLAKKRRARHDPAKSSIDYRPSEKPRESCFCRPTGDIKSETSIFDVFSADDSKAIVEQLAGWDHTAAHMESHAKYSVWTNGKNGRPTCLRRRAARLGAQRKNEEWACDECAKKGVFCWDRGEAGSRRIVLLPLPEKKRTSGLSMRDLDFWRILPKA